MVALSVMGVNVVVVCIVCAIACARASGIGLHRVSMPSLFVVGSYAQSRMHERQLQELDGSGFADAQGHTQFENSNDVIPM